jgi:hypothetical protein
VVGPEADIVAIGEAFTVTNIEEDVALHPAALVTVTLYKPWELTVIAGVVAPFDHN